MKKFINKVIRGDCLKVMKNIPNKSIDLICTDPPYNVLGKTQKWDQFDKKEFEIFTKKWLSECYRVLKPNRQAYIFWSQKFFFDLRKWKRKFDFKRILIWNHPNLAKPTNKMWLWTYDPIYFFSKGKIEIFNAKFCANENKDVMTFAKPQSNYKKDKRYHPASKPLKLIELLIKISTNENDIVLDPFLGGGTTTLAAKNLKRRFIGIEINQDYCKISRQRLRQKILL